MIRSQEAQILKNYILTNIDSDEFIKAIAHDNHTDRKHIGMPDWQLTERIYDDNTLTAATTFCDEKAAIFAVRDNIKNNIDYICNWVVEERQPRFPGDGLQKSFVSTHDRNIGKGYTNNLAEFYSQKSTIVIDKSMHRGLPFCIRTAYPNVDENWRSDKQISTGYHVILNNDTKEIMKLSPMEKMARYLHEQQDQDIVQISYQDNAVRFIIQDGDDPFRFCEKSDVSGYLYSFELREDGTCHYGMREHHMPDFAEVSYEEISEICPDGCDVLNETLDYYKTIADIHHESDDRTLNQDQEHIFSKTENEPIYFEL